MPRTYSSIDRIRAELAWVNETPDPNKCGNVRCCEETGQKIGACSRTVATGNPRTARQIESARKTELAKGEVGIKDKPPAPTLEDFSKRFTAWLATEKAEKPNTVAFYSDRVRQLLRFDKLKKAAMDQIQEELVSEYVQWRTKKTRQYALRKKHGIELADTFEPVSVACVNRDLATLRRMLNLARLWKVIPAVPIIKLLPGERSHERVLNHAEESQYLGAAPLLLRQFATIMLDTGMRPEEVCRMSWEYVHLEPVNGARFGYLHNPKGKTKHAKRNLSLTARVQSLLSMRHEAAGKPVTGWVFPANDDPKEHVPYSTIDSQHGRAINKLNEPDDEGNEPENPITPFRLYDLRHTFLTRLGEVNTDPFTIQKIAGHASIIMSQRYVHPTPERLEDAFARLETYNQAKIAPKPNPEIVVVN
jgi:integrase